MPGSTHTTKTRCAGLLAATTLAFATIATATPIAQADTTVTPEAPHTFAPESEGVTCTGTDLSIPTQDGIDYTATTVGKTTTVTAKAKAGYTIATGAQTTWTFDNIGVSCLGHPVMIQIIQEPTVTPPEKCGTDGTVHNPDPEFWKITPGPGAHQATVSLNVGPEFDNHPGGGGGFTHTREHGQLTSTSTWTLDLSKPCTAEESTGNTPNSTSGATAQPAAQAKPSKAVLPIAGLAGLGAWVVGGITKVVTALGEPVMKVINGAAELISPVINTVVNALAPVEPVAHDAMDSLERVDKQITTAQSTVSQVLAPFIAIANTINKIASLFGFRLF